MKRIYYKVKDFILDILDGIKNLIKYFSIVWNNRDYDYAFVLRMMKFQLDSLLKCLENGHEIDEDRIPKENDIKRCLILIQNILDDEYMKRVGYDNDRFVLDFRKIENKEMYEAIDVSTNPYSREEMKDMLEKSNTLRKGEVNELFDLMKNIEGWWD